MKKAYQHKIDNNELCYDKAQHAAVEALDVLLTQLHSHQLLEAQNEHLSWWRQLVNLFVRGHSLKPIVDKVNQKMTHQVQGLYFYGRVGRGKTMLMDLFYQHLTLTRKRRIHFHRFMAQVHRQLNDLTLHQKKQRNPLNHIAKCWANQVDVICFDEFFVSDIGDAMLLAGLFSAMFKQGITLVATSNCQPEQLYRNGLQRERFLETISLINQHCHVISIDGETDHRLVQNPAELLYRNYFLVNSAGNKHLACRYQLLNHTTLIEGGQLDINHRKIHYLAKTQTAIWFDFFDLCSGPRSQLDYIVIADKFSMVFLANVPQFLGELVSPVSSGVEDNYQRSGQLLGKLQVLDDEARRFIALVDELYDRNIKLFISAEVAIDQLYQGKELAFEFARCQSRLFEMQQRY